MSPTEGLIEVTVDSIRVHVPTGQYVVILKEKDADRYLPIWIGVFEATAIAHKIMGISTDRPITHDLMTGIFKELEVSVQKVVVTALADEVFFARLFLSHNGHEIDFDARPSDAVALGVRVACPIFVATDVFDRASVTPEKDESEGDNPDDDRLAVFRDFVNSLNLPDLPDEPDAPERGPSAS